MTNEPLTPPTLPTSPEVLFEASPLSLNDLAMMNAEGMKPHEEMEYIEHLRRQRVRYEVALGEKKQAKGKGTKGAKPGGIPPILSASTEELDW